MKNCNSNTTSSRQIIEQVKVERLDRIIAEKKFQIIDVRQPKGIQAEGNIPGAINIPYDEMEATIEEHLAKSQSLFSGEGPFLFCCTGGVMSYMAALLAQEKGIKNVYNLEGGHSAWKQLKESAVSA